MDKAGAYAIQGLASKFVERIEGCYFNVMGLPVALVYRRLREAVCDTPPLNSPPRREYNTVKRTLRHVAGSGRLLRW